MTTAQPRKQREMLHSMPIHSRHKLLAARLSKELREKYKARSLPVRKGDRVKIIKGDFKKLDGDVLEVDVENRSIKVQGASITKADGSQVVRAVRPSSVVLLKLAEDKERMRSIERRSKFG